MSRSECSVENWRCGVLAPQTHWEICHWFSGAFISPQILKAFARRSISQCVLWGQAAHSTFRSFSRNSSCGVAAPSDTLEQPETPPERSYKLLLWWWAWRSIFTSHRMSHTSHLFTVVKRTFIMMMQLWMSLKGGMSEESHFLLHRVTE